jgi:hypothetical protein
MLVDTVEKIAFVEEFLGVGGAQGGGAKTLGIDCEWRPRQVFKPFSSRSTLRPILTG